MISSRKKEYGIKTVILTLRIIGLILILTAAPIYWKYIPLSAVYGLIGTFAIVLFIRRHHGKY